MSKKEISALTKSGGLLSKFGGHPKVQEYRVWVHYHDGRDDDYLTHLDFLGILEMREQLKQDKSVVYLETPLAVVWDKKCQDYREVCIDGLEYSDKEE